MAKEKAAGAADGSEEFFGGLGVIRHPSLAAARLGLLGEVDYIQKRKAQGLNYTFASEADIVGAMHAACVRHGLTVTPAGCAVVSREEYATKSGSQMVRVVLQVTFTIRHAFTGEHEQAVTMGEAADSGDKATAKALTMAFKYLWRQSNILETGNDPDTTPSEAVSRAAPAETQAQRDAKALLARHVKEIAEARDVPALRAVQARLKADPPHLPPEMVERLRDTFASRLSVLQGSPPPHREPGEEG